MKIMFILIASLCLTACASAPSSDTLSKLPQYRFGDTLPSDGNYVLLFPANTPLPVSTRVDGDLFKQTGESKLEVVLKQDVYVYQQFASFDKQNWQAANKLISSNISIAIPSSQANTAGEIHFSMDKKQ